MNIRKFERVINFFNNSFLFSTFYDLQTYVRSDNIKTEHTFDFERVRLCGLQKILDLQKN